MKDEQLTETSSYKGSHVSGLSTELNKGWRRHSRGPLGWELDSSSLKDVHTSPTLSAAPFLSL